MLVAMTSVFMDPDAVELLSARLSDIAVDLGVRAGTIDGLLAEAGKSSPVPDDVWASAELLLTVGDDMARRAQMLRQADAHGWPREILNFVLGDVGNFWSGGDDGTMPWGRTGAGILRIARGPGYLSNYWRSLQPGSNVLRPPAPTTVNGGLASAIARILGPRATGLLNSNLVAGLPSARNASLLARGQGGLATLAQRAGAVRGVGIAGGAVSTGLGIADLAQQGLPHNAFEARGTEYLADVASTAFSASSTAFFIAPNPATAAATIVTGVAWVGLEAWNHREEIAEVWNDGVDAVGDFAGGVADTAEDVAGGMVDGGKQVVSALNPFNW